MNMQWFDWCIVGAVMAIATGLAIYTKRYTRSVADFLAANRCAGRYLLTIAIGEVAASAVATVAYFEMFYNAGFTGIWWQILGYPTSIIIGLSGFIVYRYRQTRALTIAQLFEIRYTRKLRIFMGILSFVSGMIMLGIFPAVGARFFIYLCGLPEVLFTIGPFDILTFPVVMIILLGTSLFYTLIGGQISVMLTDFFEGFATQIMTLVIIVVIFCLFSWTDISEALLTAPAEASRVHPLHTSKVEGFTVWYFVMWTILGFHHHKAKPETQGYECAGITAHETKMGQILGLWRRQGWWLMVLLLALGAYTVMHHPKYAAQAETVNAIVSQIQNPQIQEQVTVATTMGQYLPPGMMGIMAAVMFAAFVSTHNTFMHSWGSVLLQDVIMPFRKKPFPPDKHLRYLRFSIAVVAVSIFVFSLIFKQTEYILMFFQVTAALYVGGAGAVVIGGLYWKRATTAAAWTSMAIGTTIAAGGMIAMKHYEDFPLNGMHVAFVSAAVASVAFIIVSLFGKESFNMDKMLHKGKYATDDTKRVVGSPTGRLWKKLGITDEFTIGDRVIYFATFLWYVGWFGSLVVVVIYNVIFDVSEQTWLAFWHFYIWAMFAICSCVVVWLLIGGIMDVKKLFKRLAAIKRNELDDGWVEDHTSRDEQKLIASDQGKAAE